MNFVCMYCEKDFHNVEGVARHHSLEHLGSEFVYFCRKKTDERRQKMMVSLQPKVVLSDIAVDLSMANTIVGGS